MQAFDVHQGAQDKILDYLQDGKPSFGRTCTCFGLANKRSSQKIVLLGKFGPFVIRLKWPFS